MKIRCLRRNKHADFKQACGRASKEEISWRSAIREHKLESIANTREAIERLLHLKGQEGVKLSFESPIQDKGFRGSIDCIIEKDQSVLLVDFKRGKGSITTQKGFKEFQKIQLWFYANHWDWDEKSLGLGYVCLSDPSSSLLFFSDEKVKDSFKGPLTGSHATCPRTSSIFLTTISNMKISR